MTRPSRTLCHEDTRSLGVFFDFLCRGVLVAENASQFSNPEVPPHIIIKSRMIKGDKLINEKLSSGKIYCHITVKDNGIGFESHFSERIFGVFQKLHSKEIYSGTGIGLAIVKKIVENHNGIITATSELQKGATFDIYIPD